MIVRDEWDLKSLWSNVCPRCGRLMNWNRIGIIGPLSWKCPGCNSQFKEVTQSMITGGSQKVVIEHQQNRQEE